MLVFSGWHRARRRVREDEEVDARPAPQAEGHAEATCAPAPPTGRCARGQDQAPVPAAET